MDTRVEDIFEEEMAGDRSFQPSLIEVLFFPRRFKYRDMRETWHKGIKLGIEIGLMRASVEGQRIQLLNSTTNEKHKEFLTKFYQLADEYGCAIQYSYNEGMMVIDRRKPNINQL